MSGWWGERRVTVTGGRGFLGRHVLAVLEERGARRVDTFARRDYDLRRQADVARMYSDLEPEVVLHLAGVTGGIMASKENPGRFFYDNAMMGLELMEQARLRGLARFVQVGTVCAYPRSAPLPFREEAIWDGYPEETNGPYGIAKRMLLVQGQAYRTQYGLDSIHLLMANLYGPGDHFDPDSGHVIPALIHRFVTAREQRLERVTVWGSGQPTREFLYVEDAARAIVLAAESYHGPEPVNVGSATETSIRDLVGAVARICGYEGEVEWDTSKPDGQPRRKLDVERARREFGFSSTVPLEEGLRRTVSWYLDHRPLSSP